MGLFFRKNKDKNKRSRKAIRNSGEEAIALSKGDISDFIYDAIAHESTSALNLSAVYAAVSCISNTMSKIPYFVMDRFTKEHYPDNDLYRVLNLKPNENMNASVFHKLLWVRTLIYGEAYTLPMFRPNSLKIDELIPIENTAVEKLWTADKRLYYRVELPSGQSAVFRPDELVVFKAITLDGINGISPLEYARITTEVGINQEKFARDFYENYGRPSDYLSTQADLSSKETEVTVTNEQGERVKVRKSLKDALRESWEGFHSGDKKRFRTAILDNGLSYNVVAQITPEQMQFVNSKSVNVDDIARFFDMGSCSFKLGTGKQSYSTNEQGQICYITETIVSKLRQAEIEFTLKLLSQAQQRRGLVIKGNITAELRGDASARANFYDKMRSMGVFNINEIRALEDLPSIGNDGDTRLIGANSVPLEKLIRGESAADATPNVLQQQRAGSDDTNKDDTNEDGTDGNNDVSENDTEDENE